MPDTPATLSRNRSVRSAAVAVAVAATPTACAHRGSDLPGSPPFKLMGVRGVTRIAQLTGPDSLNRTDRFEVAGQDLGSMFEMNGKTWFVFGDTFGRREVGLTGGGGEEWRSNTLAYSTDTVLDDGI